MKKDTSLLGYFLLLSFRAQFRLIPQRINSELRRGIFVEVFNNLDFKPLYTPI